MKIIKEIINTGKAGFFVWTQFVALGKFATQALAR